MHVSRTLQKFGLYSAVILNSLKCTAKLFLHWFKRVPYWRNMPCRWRRSYHQARSFRTGQTRRVPQRFRE